MFSYKREMNMYSISLNTQCNPQRNLAKAESLHLLDEGRLLISQLCEEDREEVLGFLGQRPSHTFGLCGFIRANGLVSPLNRGSYYACRDEQGQIHGVALIGHHILFETASETAIQLFAELAQSYDEAFVLLAEKDKAERFWHYYAAGGKAIRVSCRELLLEQRWPVEVRETVSELRSATLDDLDLVAPAHAQIAYQESGVNPLEQDREGFLARYSRRIQNGKTWVWIEDGKLIFKADIISDTPDVIYLEGIWVNPDDRNKGLGLRCLAQLTQQLLQRTKAVCLLVNQDFREAQAFYQKAGFKFLSLYDTIYLQEEETQLN
jgi:ribosomal protein S18 acetylase RimI-like enzyme